MATLWYCRLMGTELGPFTSKQLLEMARSHQLTPDDAVKRESDARWVPAHRVKDLFDDPSSSTIIMASLPPEVKEADERKPETEAETPKLEPGPIKWYYISDQHKVGPLSFDELAAHGREGLLQPRTRVWSSKSPKWREAKDVKGLVFEKSIKSQQT